MTNKKTIVCLGHNENIYIFNSIGIDGYIIKEEKEIPSLVRKLVEEGIKIFLVSEKFTEEVEMIREKYKGNAYPIFLILPMDGKLTGEGVKRISRNVEKATGINLF